MARLKITISLENFKILNFFKIWALRVWGHPQSNPKSNFLTRRSDSKVTFSGQKVTFGVTFRVTMLGANLSVRFFFGGARFRN